jgi:hypothetical protein
MKSLIFILLIAGLSLIATGYVKSNQYCPPPTVEFRYLPKSFEQEHSNPTPLMGVHGSMFSDKTPELS